jgi:hypothetical protein
MLWSSPIAVDVAAKHHACANPTLWLADPERDRVSNCLDGAVRSRGWVGLLHHRPPYQGTPPLEVKVGLEPIRSICFLPMATMIAAFRAIGESPISTADPLVTAR